MDRHPFGGLYTSAVVFWPLAGWLTGAVTAGVFSGLSFLLPTLPAIILALVARLLLTGALHEDGLADVCDGFGGGRDKESVLRIMKDSPYRDLRNDRPDLLFSTCHISTGILAIPADCPYYNRDRSVFKILRIATCQYTAVCTPLKEPKQNPLSKNDGISVHPEYAVRLHSSDSPGFNRISDVAIRHTACCHPLLPHTSHATENRRLYRRLLRSDFFQSAKQPCLSESA